MSGKKLSNGTLGLRFMQNAQRAKQATQVEAEQAKVRDDGEWEIAKEVRDAWGPASGSRSEQTVTYETSYLPFLFPSLPAAAEGATPPGQDSDKPKGRRTFNHKGKEVEIDIEKPAPSPHAQTPSSKGAPSQGSRRPVSISDPSGATRTTIITGARNPSKPARQVISDTSGVGTDLRLPSSASSLGKTFLKPSGVDEPNPTAASSVLPGASAETPGRSARDEDIVLGARSARKGKRGRETLPEGEGKKRKKKRMPLEQGTG